MPEGLQGRSGTPCATQWNEPSADDRRPPPRSAPPRRPRRMLTGTGPGWVGPAPPGTPRAVVRRGTAAGRTLPRRRPGPRPAPTARDAHTSRGRRRRRPARRPPAGGSVITPETPALAALRECRPILDGLGRPWGPTGSAGFELATGHRATTQASDLDLLIRLGTLCGFTRAADLASQLSKLPARVDCQLETGYGAVALAELATHPDKIVLRTNDGPRLVTLEQAMTMP